MLPDTQIQEEISRAYIYAIASKAGFTFDKPGTDYDSVDIKISAIGKPHESSILESPTLELQVKATYAHDFNEGNELHFPLKIKNYNDLRKNTAAPRILVIFLMPVDKELWVRVNHDKLEVQRCAYWLSLKGMKDVSDQGSKTVIIPKSNMFNVDSLIQMMIKISKDEELSNAV